MQLADIYARKGVFWITTKSRTTDRLWMTDGPVQALLSESSVTELGEAVLYALSRSRQLQCSVSWDAPSALLRASGAKSWRAFEKDTRVIWVKRDTHLFLTPTMRQKPGGGELPLPEGEQATILPAEATPEELGNAIHQVLERCR